MHLYPIADRTVPS